MNNMAYLTATELAPLIQTKQLSPVELVKHMLDRIDKIDQTINAYITPLHELALKQAKAAEDDIMKGQYKGPLHGIPIGIKDNYETKGVWTTGGSKLFENYIPEQTATSVEKLLGAGGIMLGKLHMNELGIGSSGINPAFGITRNPWNKDYMPGGSSGGSGASLAAGLATLATGTDTWGSNRVPAAMSGVCGLKPTFGLVSAYGILPSAWSLDNAGPFARSVSDLALMLNHMAGYDPKVPTSLNIPLPDYTADLNKDIKGIKIGIPTYYLEGLDTDIEKLFKDAVAALKNLGAEIIELTIPELSMATFCGYVTAAGEASAFNYDSLQTHSQDYNQDVRAFLLSGSLVSSPFYSRAQQARRKLTKAFKKVFEDIDIICGPTVPIATPALRENWVDQNLEIVKRCLPFTVPANLTGIPSLSVPLGLCSKGLPAGMQFMGKHLSEKLLLQVGSVWESTKSLSYESIKL